jgi:HEAT repeat protein
LHSASTTTGSIPVYLLAARRAGDVTEYRRALGDPDHRVRIEAVRALVSVDDLAGVVAATGDESREVRIAAAAGLASLGDGAQGSRAVSALVGDLDPLARAAALAALGELGCGDDDFAAVERALQAPAWQVREGAARALSGAAAQLAVLAISGLTQALADVHLDVRKAAVLSLTRWAGEPIAHGTVRDTLSIVLKDSDADVRAYARRALEIDG